MKDVRNSDDKTLRWSIAQRGWTKEEYNQYEYLTWVRWGHDNRHKSHAEFRQLFDIEWDKVTALNMETYGRLDPWDNTRNRRYFLKEPKGVS